MLSAPEVTVQCLGVWQGTCWPWELPQQSHRGGADPGRTGLLGGLAYPRPGAEGAWRKSRDPEKTPPTLPPNLGCSPFDEGKQPLFLRLRTKCLGAWGFSVIGIDTLGTLRPFRILAKSEKIVFLSYGIFFFFLVLVPGWSLGAVTAPLNVFPHL